MKTIDLKDISSEERLSSEQLLVNLLRTKYAHLDLRSGTALRDLLVVPDALLQAWFSKQAEEQREVSSLQALLARSESGEDIDLEDINRVLSNFNLVGTAGTAARGVVRIVVRSARTYVVAAGDVFETLDGVKFTADSTITAEEMPISGEVKLFKGTANYYFFVPVTCTITGESGNITKGTALSAKNSFSGFVSATAYGDFSGGADVENLRSIVDRIPVALSSRGLLTATTVESVLRDRFDSSNNPIIAVSSVGYGNPAQRRDKHNPFGIGVGGRVDIYVRNFTTPHVVSLTKTCIYDPSTGDYTCHISAGDAPGLQQVVGVSDADSSAAASYAFASSFGGEQTSDTWHDFDTETDFSELAGTVWRTCDIIIKNTGFTEQERVFNIDVVCLPDIVEIQSYVDDDSVRNVSSDFVVRCPAICRVSINATCRYKYGTLFDLDEAKSALVKYINTSGFVGRITRSEIACVLKSVGAISVDITSNYMLTGYVVDSMGITHRLTGDALDIDEVQTAEGMLTKDTCVFSTAPENINITAIPA